MASLIIQGDNYGTRRRCDATCHNATGHRCECICGGRYHGKGSSSKALLEVVKSTEAEFRALHPELDQALSALEGLVEVEAHLFSDDAFDDNPARDPDHDPFRGMA